MNLERMLQIAVATMAGLGSLLLGIGQGSVLLPLVAIAAAALGVYCTDVTGLIRLGRALATLAALVALGISVFDFLRQGPDSQLLAIANLLLYLQVVLMFQQKDIRIYWQLMMLSLLQVVVAAALSFSLQFGLLLVLYMFVGLLALSLLFAYRETSGYQPIGLIPRSASLADRRRGDFAGRQVFAPVCREDLAAWPLGRDLARQVLVQGLVTLGLAFLIFFAVPRFEKGALLQRAIAARGSIGFNETVELGRLGEAFQNPASVMRVWFTAADTGQPYAVVGEPLFRGAVVDTYVRGAWSLYVAKDVRGRDNSTEPVELADAGNDGRLVMERIALEPQAESTVFSVFPAFRASSACPVEYHPERQQLIRKNRHERIEFMLGTNGFRQGRQTSIAPNDWSLGDKGRRILVSLPEAQPGDADPLARLRKFAAAAVEGLPPGDRVGQARALERALRDSRQFEYTLAGQKRDRSLDPIEDFVGVNRRGHCEYFSSALTLMLRSRGIPARMVIGYKGGEYNSLGNYYQVRKLHAHTWVEAYLDEQFLPPDYTGSRVAGAWLRLDPTPGSSDDGAIRDPTLAQRARDWLDYGDYLWTNYVVGLNAKRQYEAVYAPLTVFVDAVRHLFTRSMWTETLPNFVASLFSRATWRAVWRDWPDWLAAAALAVLVVSSAWWWRRRRSRGRGQAAAGALRRRPAQRAVAFYERLEALLARQGIRRPESQTQHEFAVGVAGQFVESPQLAPVAWVPRRIVEAFYRVRFGRHALDNNEIEQVEQALGELAASLAARRPR